MYGNNVTWLDRFCAKHPRFGIPNLMLYIAIGNVAIGLIDNFSAYPLSYSLFFLRDAIFQGEIWRLVTFIIVPITGDFGILNFSIPGTSFFMTVLSAYFYYWVGSMLEREWGTAKLNLFFFTGVLLNIIFGLVLGVASIAYVNLSMFFAFAVLFPDMVILFMFVLPVKVKWLALIDAAFFVWNIFRNLMQGLWVFALMPVVAILNFFLFFWPDFRYLFDKAKRRANPTVINFKKAQKQAKKKAKETGGYTHKCAVCGITDADDPNMEFRYCSKCDGYYCYCINHINNHVHIHEK